MDVALLAHGLFRSIHRIKILHKIRTLNTQMNKLAAMIQSTKGKKKKLLNISITGMENVDSMLKLGT